MLKRSRDGYVKKYLSVTNHSSDHCCHQNEYIGVTFCAKLTSLAALARLSIYGISRSLETGASLSLHRTCKWHFSIKGTETTPNLSNIKKEKNCRSALRRLTGFFILVGSAMFAATYGYTCRNTIIFGTLKDSILKVNSLPTVNNCFSCRNVLQNGVNALSKMVFKSSIFCQKLNILYILDHAIWFKFCVTNTYQIMYGEILAFQCQNLQRQPWQQFKEF